MKGPVDLSSPASIYGKIRDTIHHGVEHMIQKKEIMDKLSIYIPQPKMAEKPVERPIKLGGKKDRSINYLLVEAILEYLKWEEGK